MNCQTLDGFLLDTEQWGNGTTSKAGTTTVDLPISATVLLGVASDAGTSPIYYSFNASNVVVYGKTSSGDFGYGYFAYIVICR